MLDYFINFYNKHFNKNVSYKYSEFFECNFFNFDFEEDDLCLM